MDQKKLAQPLSTTLLSAAAEDVLELDELWSFVGTRARTVWLWLALCRRTRQIVAYHLGPRDHAACTDLRAKLPPGYHDCRSFSDLWSSYAAVFDPDLHRSGPKQNGDTNHVERFNATLRNRLGRLTRKSLSFSKSFDGHQATIHAFLLAYNAQIATGHWA